MEHLLLHLRIIVLHVVVTFLRNLSLILLIGFLVVQVVVDDLIVSILDALIITVEDLYLPSLDDLVVNKHSVLVILLLFKLLSLKPGILLFPIVLLVGIACVLHIHVVIVLHGLLLLVCLVALISHKLVLLALCWLFLLL